MKLGGNNQGCLYFSDTFTNLGRFDCQAFWLLYCSFCTFLGCLPPKILFRKCFEWAEENVSSGTVVFSGLTLRIPQTVYQYSWAYPFLLFSSPFFHFLLLCGRLSRLVSAFEHTLKYHLVSYHTSPPTSVVSFLMVFPHMRQYPSTELQHNTVNSFH